MVLVDTPGFYEPRHALGRLMRKSAQEETSGSDLILFVADASFPPGKEDREVAEHLFLRKAAEGKSVFLVLNKKDLVSEPVLENRIEQYSALGDFKKVFSVSCSSGANLDVLFNALLAELPEGPLYYPPDAVTDQDERTMIREIIREKILQVTRQEVPHSVAVEVEEMRPAAGREMAYIRAEAFVEKDSQKGILVGAGGKRLKLISTNARKEIEKLLGEKVFLDLWVKVKPEWRDREDVLRAWGYE
jgi:GTP-binding protein Era